MNTIQKPTYLYICVHCGDSKLSPTLPKGWKEFNYLDTTDNYGNTWHIGYKCAECNKKESDNENN